MTNKPSSELAKNAGRVAASSAASAGGAAAAGSALGAAVGASLLTTVVTSAVVSFGVSRIAGSGGSGGPIGPDLSLTGTLTTGGLASLNGGVDTTTLAADTINVDTINATTLNLSGPISLSSLTDLTVTNSLTVDTDSLVVVPATNSVGIRNAAPTEALDVTGNIKSSGTITGSNLAGTINTASQPNITSLGTLSSLTVSGDVTIDTDVLKVNTTSNRVGINNSAPTQALDVNGNILSSGSVTGSTLGGTISTGAQPNITSLGTLSSLAVSGDLTVDTNTLKVNSTTNRVGINNATPSEALDVTGNIKSSGTVSGSNLEGTLNTSAQPSITSLGTLSSLTVSGDLTVDTNTLKVDTTNNFVGVNKSVPTQALDVVGNVAATGSISGSSLSGTLNTGAQPNISSLGTLSSLTVSGDVTIDTDVVKVNTTLNRVGINKAVPSEALDVNGNILSSGSVTGSTLGGTISTGAQPNITSLGTLSSLAVSGDLVVDTNTLKVDSTNNFVGVNKTTPAQALDVVGNIAATGTISGSNLAGTIDTASQPNISSLGTLSSLTVSGDVTIDTDVVKVNTTLNRVGINNAVPSEALDVTGNIKSSGTITGSNLSGTIDTASQPNITSLGTLSSLTVSGDVTIDTDVVKVNTTLNRVGINNATPSEALDVTGNIKSSGTITGTTLTGTLSTASQPNITSLGTLSSLTVTGDLAVDTNTLKVDSTNNYVGVNKTVPTEALDVVGNITATGSISGSSLSGTISTSSQPNITSLGTLSSLTVTGGLTVDTDVLKVDVTNNRVGINNATPLEALDVIGNIKASGSVTTNDLISGGTIINIGSTSATETLNIACGSNSQIVNIGTTGGGTTINIGSTGDTVNIGGVLAYNNTTNLNVANKQIFTNVGGAAGSGGGAGLFVEEGGVSDIAYVKVAGTRDNWVLKAPTGSESTILTTSGPHFVTNGSNLYYSTGSVGIGSTTPTVSLDVVGSIRATGTITATGGLEGTLASLNITGDATFGATSMFVNSTSNRVGINNALPGYTLDVTGDINASGSIYGTLNTASQPNITSLGTLSSLTVSGDVTIDTDVVKVNTTTNRVGINNATPSEALDVTGNIKSSGTITGSNLAGTIDTASQPNITSVGTLSSLTVSGDATFDTSTLKVDSTNNRVGVNTSAPGYTLDVDGPANLRTGHTYKINGSDVLSSDSLGSGVLNSSLTSVGTLSSLTVSGDATFDTSTLKVDSTNNRVGVNTSAPGYTLDVDGPTNLRTGHTYKINGSDVLSADTLGSGVLNSSLTSVGNLTTLTVDTSTLVVDSGNDRVGINTSVPGYTLDVDGPANLRTGHTYKINGSDVLSATTLGSGVTGSSLTSVGTLSSLTVSGDLTVDSSTLKVDSTNNRVGINNATPSEALDVTGNIKSSGTITGSNLAGTIDTASQPNITSVGTLSSLTVSGDATFDTSTLKVDSTNNRVGVNTSAPGYTLDVDGPTNLRTGHTYKINGSDVLSSDTLGSGVLNSSLTSVGNLTSLTVDTSTLVVDATNNRVGINTTTPGFALDVDGPTNLRTGHTYKINGSDVLSTDTLGSGVLNSSLTSVGNLTSLTVDTSTLVVDATNNRVGINTTTPGYSLDVDGNSNLRTGHTYKINGSDVLSSDTLGTGILNSSLTSVGTLSSLVVSGDATFDTSTLKVDSTNNRVGVNTSAPGYTLDVDGPANLRTGHTYKINGSDVLSATTLGSGVTSSSLTSVGNLTTLTVDTTTLVVDSGNDRVGINTSAPGYTLDVDGPANLRTGHTYKINGSDVLSATTLGSGVTSSSLTSVGNLTTLTVDTTTLVVDSGNDRVGINTSAPGYTLDVDGPANLRTGHTYKINGSDVLSATTLGSGVTGSSLTSVGTLSSLTVSGDLTVDSSTLKVDSTNNRVGINTSVPEHALDIDGNVNLKTGHAYKINGSDVLSATTLGSGITSSSLTSVGTLSSLTVTGATVLDGGLTMDTNKFTVADSTGDVLTAGTLTVAGDVAVDANVFVVNTSTNRVGINKTTPDEALDVTGNVKVSSKVLVDTVESIGATMTIGSSSDTTTLNLACGTNTQIVNIGTNSGATTINIGGSGDTVNIAGTLTYVQTTNLQVTDHAIVLNKGGGAGTGGGAGILVEEGGVSDQGYIKVAPDRNSWLLKKPNSGNTETILTDYGPHFVSADSDIVFSTGNVGIGTTAVSGAYKLEVVGDVSLGTNSLIVDSTNDRVGIGKTNPSQALDVVGNVVISGDLTVDSTTLKVDSGNNRVGINTASPSVPLEVVGDVDIKPVAGGSTLVVKTISGTVGIGTTDPDQSKTLDVFGTSNFSSTMTVGGSLLNIFPSGSSIGIGTTNPDPLVMLDIQGKTKISNDFTVDTDTFKVSSTNHNVGIGTASPNAAYQLEVWGKANITDDFSINTTAFTIDAQTGNTSITGTLDVDGSLTVLDSQFTKAPEIITIPVNDWQVKGAVINGETPGDKFGTAVSITSDGLGLAVSAPNNPAGGTSFNPRGSVRVYTWDGTSWNQRGSDIDGADDDYSGYTNLIVSDDATVVITCAQAKTFPTVNGNAKVYAWDGSSWNQRGSTFTGSGGFSSVAMDSSGTTVAFEESTNLVKVYSWSGSSWSQKGSSLSVTYSYVSLSGDGNTLLIGDTEASGLAGEVRAYSWDSGSSSWIQKGSTITGTSNEFLGSYIDLASSGNAFICTGINSSPPMVYTWNGSSWVQRGSVPETFTTGGLAISTDGSRIGLLTNSSAGANAKIYTWNGSSWVQTGTNLLSSVLSNSTGTIDISDLGTYIAVGDPTNTRARVYEFITDRNVNLTASRLQIEDNSRITVYDEALTSENLNGDILFETRPVNTDPWTERMRIQGSGGVSVSGDISATTLTGTLSTAAQGNVTSLGTLTSLTVSGDVTVDTNVLKVLSSSNKVGINKSVPTEALDVVGNITSSGTITGTTLTGTLSTATQSNVTTLGTLTSLTVSGLATMSGGLSMDNFSVADTSGNVSTAGLITSTKTLAPTTSWSSVTQTDSKILFYDNTGNNWSGLGVDNGGHLWIRTGTTAQNLLVMRADGNVGIGVTNPSTTLDVSGSLRVGDPGSPSFQIDLGRSGVGTTRSAYVFGNGVDMDIVNQQNGYLQFSSNNTPRMTISATGNVGIGSTTPQSKLNITGSMTWESFASGKTIGSAQRLGYGSGLGIIGGSTNQLVNNQYYDGTDFRYWQTGAASGIALNTDNAQFRFYPSGTADAVVGATTTPLSILSTGNVGIGSTIPSAKLWVNTTSYPGIYSYLTSDPANRGYSAYYSRVDNTSDLLMYFVYSGSGVGSITTNGTGVSYNTTSDYRLKENISDIGSQLERLKKLRPVTYTWKSSGVSSEGFLAHELQEQFPAAVIGEKDEISTNGEPKYQMIDTSHIIPSLVGGVKELAEENAQLKQEIQELKAELAGIKSILIAKGIL